MASEPGFSDDGSVSLPVEVVSNPEFWRLLEEDRRQVRRALIEALTVKDAPDA